MTPLVTFLLLFLAVGIGFIFVHLVAGKLIRPSKPDAEKGTIYECGEPTIGSAWVQFDLRFYVVALLFVIFDVEVAFFFPWAEVFGKANAIVNMEKPTTEKGWQKYSDTVLDLAGPKTTKVSNDGRRQIVEKAREATAEQVLAANAAEAAAQEAETLMRAKVDVASAEDQWTAEQKQLVTAAQQKRREANKVAVVPNHQFNETRKDASTIASLALIEVLVFFGVLLVGFAYLWKRGDIEWVRSTAAERVESRTTTTTAISSPTPARETIAF